MYIIVGLGNPDKKYAKNMHNLGFMTLDRIADEANILVNKSGFKALYGQGEINGEKVVLVKPQTYMNLSGESVQEIVNFYKVPLTNVIIIYDDLDVNIGSLRIRQKGSAGTHNGMRSIVSCLNSQEFPRIRIGSKPKEPFMDIVDYVLSDIRKEDRDTFNSVFDKAVKAVFEICKGKPIEDVMSRFNG